MVVTAFATVMLFAIEEECSEYRAAVSMLPVTQLNTNSSVTLSKLTKSESVGFL